jgi:glyoxylase-like metal-dependent hydrolase (beta-lactamase superfamily II)
MVRVLAVLGLLLVAGLLVLAGFLAEAHFEIRSLDPTIPSAAELADLAGAEDAPSRVAYANTASQRGPNGTMAHPVFLLEWADGRLFAIDTGMEREAALAFGEPMELLLDAEPAEAYGAPRELLGPATDRIAGVAFTHLHMDHTGGLASICEGRAPTSLPVFQTPWQADRGNYTTSPGRDAVSRAGCARPERLAGGPLHPVPGFPGLAAMQAGGHTPGSTIYFAAVGDTIWVFSGDVTNFKDALLENRPKEKLYSLLITPEAPEPLARLRVWLAGLDAEPGFRVVVSHDHVALEKSGLPVWLPEAEAPEVGKP